MKFDFNSLNFEVLDSNVNAYPDLFVNMNGLTFSKRVLEDMGYPAYVLCMIDAKARVFAIRPCKGNEAKAFKFAKPKSEQKAVCTLSSKNIMEPIRAITKDIWEPKKRYKVTGFWVADAKTMCFDLSEGQVDTYRQTAESEEA